jgi:type IV pilus assembly protein PilM
MAKRLNSVLGIDIGSERIKVCEFQTKGKEPVVTALGMIPTPEGAVDHTGVYNADAVGAALKQVLSEAGATSGNAVVSIAGQASVLVRTLEVPRMTADELKDHMQWEINRNIPFAESNVVTDYKPLPDEDPNSQNMEVVMAIAPQSAIDTIISCVKKAGRTASAIDVEPLSMARALQQSYSELMDKTVCVVDMGAKTTSINIYRGSRLLMPRQIPLGGELFTKAIADALTVPVEQAESIKLTRASVPENAADLAMAPSTFGGAPAGAEFTPYNPFADEPSPTFQPMPAMDDAPMNPFAEPDLPGVPSDPVATGMPGAEPGSALPAMMGDPETVQLYQAMAPTLEEFVSEIRRSIDYFRSRGGDVDQIALCGGGTKLKGLAQFIAKSLAVPTESFDPLRNLNVNARKVAPGFVEDHRQEFAVAVGNGLHIFFE